VGAGIEGGSRFEKAEKVRGMIRIVPETAEAGRGKTK
jgi:hypothetical protein